MLFRTISELKCNFSGTEWRYPDMFLNGDSMNYFLMYFKYINAIIILNYEHS